MTHRTGRWIAAAAAVLILLAGVWLGAAAWDECREAGFSRVFCLRLILR